MTIQIIYYTQSDIEEKQVLAMDGYFIAPLSGRLRQFYTIPCCTGRGGRAAPGGGSIYVYTLATRKYYKGDF